MTKKKAKKKIGMVIGRVTESLGRFIHLETTDGVAREGKLTGLRTQEVILNGQTLDMPVALELNGDPNDFIMLLQIYRLDID